MSKKFIVSIDRPFDISETDWQDFIIHRKAKGAPITETVLRGFRREAEKAKLSISEAIETSINRDWRGFKAEWLFEKPKFQTNIDRLKENTRKHLESLKDD